MPRYHTSSWREPNYLLLMICLGFLVGEAARAEAAVMPRAPEIVFSHSADFPEMTFVVYSIKEDDPWANGSRVDATSSKIVPAGEGLHLPFGKEVAVLAVPRSLAEKAKEVPDLGWIESTAPGVVRVPGTLWVPRVFRDIALHYRLEKAERGPKLVLLDAEALKAAEQQWPDVSAETPNSQLLFVADPLFLWGLLAGGGLGLAVGLCFSWRFKRSKDRPAGARLS